jgi:hypothetical protein
MFRTYTFLQVPLGYICCDLHCNALNLRIQNLFMTVAQFLPHIKQGPQKICRLLGLTHSAFVYERNIREKEDRMMGVQAIIGCVQLCAWSPIKL